MSVELLQQDLRRKSGQRVAAIRRQAEHDAGILQTAYALELAAAMARQQRLLEEAGREVAAPVLRASEIQALRIEDEAWQELAGRLQAVAMEELELVRQAGYDALFAALVAELPEVDWAEVRVHPGDLALARAHFPGAKIIGEPAVTGGFMAVSRQGGHRVVSTLERRLERAWPFVLPRLLKEIGEGLHAAPAD